VSNCLGLFGVYEFGLKVVRGGLIGGFAYPFKMLLRASQ